MGASEEEQVSSTCIHREFRLTTALAGRRPKSKGKCNYVSLQRNVASNVFFLSCDELQEAFVEHGFVE
eukprot:2450560-Amphidinium_carterae.1